MTTVDYTDLRHDTVLQMAAEEAHGLLRAIAIPGGLPVLRDRIQAGAVSLDEPLPPVDAVGESSAAALQSVPKADHVAPQAATAHVASPDDAAAAAATPIPMLEEVGVFEMCGVLPWIGPKGQKGKPSFCVVIRKSTGLERKLWGSDLERALREAGVIQGDTIKLTKYPRVKYQVGNRVVQRNLWIVERLPS